MGNAAVLRLFDAVGIELEYMIVSRDTLDVLPVCDRIIQAETGAVRGDAEFDDITWSNELALHVIELKASEPATDLPALLPAFNQHLARIQTHLGALGGRLMPTAMHPWMNPHTQMKLWPHDNGEIYAAFDRIFNCKGHGWANLQSMHINLPFFGDEEFGRLHAAIRLVLPILPALAASSPFMDNRSSGLLDTRLNVYRQNCAAIPSCTGRVIPEPVFTRADYQSTILDPIYSDLAPHDPQGILQEEFSNARGAIARFERGSIEIRVIDVQESPAADLAIASATIALIKILVSEAWSTWPVQQALAVDPLENILSTTIRDGEFGVVRSEQYLQAMGLTDTRPCTAGQLWQRLIEMIRRHDASLLAPFDGQLDHILAQGPLARRLLCASATRTLPDIYRNLCDCLEQGTLFTNK